MGLGAEHSPEKKSNPTPDTQILYLGGNQSVLLGLRNFAFIERRFLGGLQAETAGNFA